MSRSAIGGSSSSAGPSTIAAQTSSATSSTPTDLWSDILRSADKKKIYSKKNVLILSERHYGRKHLINQLLGAQSIESVNRRKKKLNGTLAIGYEVLQVRDEGDEEAVPPLSIFYPPDMGKNGLGLIKAALPTNSIPDTAVMIILDWTRPGGMAKELIGWLNWIEDWCYDSKDSEEMRSNLQAHLQNYSEPSIPSPTSSSSSQIPSNTYSSNAPLLPLGPGTLTLNKHGIPIMVVCTKADLMDSCSELIGMKGAIWEERCDWAQQVIRTICLSYGAALFYTSSTQPSTYSLLRSYILHRLHSTPQSTDNTSSIPTTQISRFPFMYRANVLDRDAVMVPSGWDTWGKINVLRDGFDPASILDLVQKDLEEEEGKIGKSLEDVWVRMIPDISRTKPNNNTNTSSTTEPEQSFLMRQYDLLQKDPNRDPRTAFRQPIISSSSTSTIPLGNTSSEDRYSGYGGIVGPLSSSGGGLSLPGVEKAMMEMEGQGVEDLKEKFAKLGRKEGGGGGGNLNRPLISPGTPGIERSGERAVATGGGVPNEALHSFFQGLLASKGKTTAVPKASPS